MGRWEAERPWGLCFWALKDKPLFRYNCYYYFLNETGMRKGIISCTRLLKYVYSPDTLDHCFPSCLALACVPSGTVSIRNNRKSFDLLRKSSCLLKRCAVYFWTSPFVQLIYVIPVCFSRKDISLLSPRADWTNWITQLYSSIYCNLSPGFHSNQYPYSILRCIEMLHYSAVRGKKEMNEDFWQYAMLAVC